MIKQSKEFANQRHGALKGSFKSTKVRHHFHYKTNTNHKRANTPKTHKTKPSETKHNNINFSSYSNAFYKQKETTQP